MIIKQFEEIVKRFPDRTVLKANSKSLTYTELNLYSNRVGHAIRMEDKKECGVSQKDQVALLFDHGAEMVVGCIGGLKANKTYVPLDSTYPGKRLLYILENSETYLILTDNRNLSLARELSDYGGNRIGVLNIETLGTDIPDTNIEHDVLEDKIAYILYTSGSTGKPKGVFQTHRNMLYYTRNWSNRFSITERDRMSLFTSFTHDGAIQDIYSALLSGACLYPYSMKKSGNAEEYYSLLINEQISVWHSVPSLYRFFCNTLSEKDQFPSIRWVLLGGEPLRKHDFQLFKSYFPKACLVNVYGQTESSVSTTCVLTHENTFDDLCLGEPLDETKILLVDEEGNIVEEIGGGEIVISSNYLSPGYWRDPENSARVFTHDELFGNLYWTGDIGRLTGDGAIKMLGRKDFQVKIRGFRVETGEIETELLQHYAVDEVVVVARLDENEDNYLCAYVVLNQYISPDDLRVDISESLPDYMIPRFFISLEKMPLNSTGKIDRLQLPQPEEVESAGGVYVAPTNEVEEKVALIWQDVLGVEKIGINDNFIELGGHSLLVVSIISKIHKEFDVELEIMDVFNNSTVKELSQLLMNSKQSVFTSIEPVEEKEYYTMSYQQKGLYYIQKLNPESISYNMPLVFILKGEIQMQKIETALMRLIERHKILQTSFEIINDNSVQRVHHDVSYGVEYYTLDRDVDITEIMSYIKPFDLSVAPLLRLILLKINNEKHILIWDLHHIITDLASHVILMREFMKLYSNKKEELPPLRIHYHDYSEWHFQLRQSGELNRQEEYWLKKFQGKLPMLQMATDFRRKAEKDLRGDRDSLTLDIELSKKIKKYINEFESTLYIFMLSVYTLLLSKYSGQDDIIVGSPVSGRTHLDLYSIIGLFANMLPMRNFPKENLRFRDYLKEVKFNTLSAFDNQEYQFTELVSKLNIPKDISRHPIFDAVLALENTTLGHVESENTQFQQYNFNFSELKFDLLLDVWEAENFINISLNYSISIFKSATAEKMLHHLVEIIQKVIEDDSVLLKDIIISHTLLRVESVFPGVESNPFEF